MGYIPNHPVVQSANDEQILGQKFVKFFVGILVQTMTPKAHFEINGPLPSENLCALRIRILFQKRFQSIEVINHFFHKIRELSSLIQVHLSTYLVLHTNDFAHIIFKSV